MPAPSFTRTQVQTRPPPTDPHAPTSLDFSLLSGPGGREAVRTSLAGNAAQPTFLTTGMTLHVPQATVCPRLTLPGRDPTSSAGCSHTVGPGQAWERPSSKAPSPSPGQPPPPSIRATRLCCGPTWAEAPSRGGGGVLQGSTRPRLNAQWKILTQTFSFKSGPSLRLVSEAHTWGTQD